MGQKSPIRDRAAGLRLGFHLADGMKVGLYGGTFDPPHEGHAHVAGTALKALGLDRVIWLVSPRNPQKPAPPTAATARMAAARRVAQGPSMVVSDAESRLGSAFTIDTVLRLKARFPKVHFVWIMGADGLATFHTWRAWRRIMAEIPIAVVARPGVALRSRFSPAAAAFSRHRLAARAARILALAKPPAWIYLPAPLKSASSTALRNRS